MNDYYAKDFIQQGHCYLFFKFNSPRRHEVHEEKPKKNLRVLRVFVVKCLKLMSMELRFRTISLASNRLHVAAYILANTAATVSPMAAGVGQIITPNSLSMATFSAAPSSADEIIAPA